jgi:urease accessory protein
VVTVRVLEGVRGNVETDPDLAAARDRHRERGTLERLRVDDARRRRSRFRASTDAGRELGVVVPGADPLATGDVLLADDVMVVVELSEVPALAVTFPADADPARAAAVGHAVGNRHWDLAVEDETLYVPAGPDPDGRHRLLDALVPAAATIERTAVEPSLFDRSESGVHGNSTESDHDHSHDPRPRDAPGVERR